MPSCHVISRIIAAQTPRRVFEISGLVEMLFRTRVASYRSLGKRTRRQDIPAGGKLASNKWEGDPKSEERRKERFDEWSSTSLLDWGSLDGWWWWEGGRRSDIHSWPRWGVIEPADRWVFVLSEDSDKHSSSSDAMLVFLLDQTMLGCVALTNHSLVRIGMGGIASCACSPMCLSLR